MFGLKFLPVLHVMECCMAQKMPNILFIVADDYGYNDVGYHGSEIETPAIDRLAMQGVRLENYYVLPVCTPTRSAIISGRFSIRTGLQVSTISPAKPYGLDTKFTTVADELRSIGYSTHALGKWHLGFCHENFMPHRRGFDTFHGYVNGEEQYFSHMREPGRVAYSNFTSGFDYYYTDMNTGAVSIDWSQNETGPADNVDPSEGLCYSAHLLAYRAATIVRAHPTGPQAKPLFMYLAFQSVHAPLQAPAEYIERYNWMQRDGYTPVNKGRQTYAGMVAALDEAVLNVTNAFKRKDASGVFWDNTLLVFTTDNGGIGAGNNWPLRGRKATLWEGGTRGVAFVHGYGIEKAGYANFQMIHAVDWLPTLLHASTGEVPDTSTGRLAGIDGIDVWGAISRNASSPRTDFVYNIEPINLHTANIKAGAVRMHCHKYIVGEPGKGTYDPKPEPKPQTAMLIPSTAYERGRWRQGSALAQPPEVADSLGPWLFDICKDPEETVNLYGADKVVNIQKQLEAKLEAYRQQEVPALYNTHHDDWRADPSLNNGTWSPGWCDATAFLRDSPHQPHRFYAAAFEELFHV